LIDEINTVIEVNGYMSLTFHPQIEGFHSRLKVLDKVIDYILKHDGWIMTGKELAKWANEFLA